jgi:hypothetical protein
VSFYPRLAALWRNLTQRARVEQDLDLVKEQVRGVKAGAGVESLLQDLRYAARTVRRAPIVALTGVLSLGIGIAGNAVVFMLYGVQPLDPVSFAGGALLFGTLALVASVIPARRAASVNPVEALRAQ